jgi:hypothetical protein
LHADVGEICQGRTDREHALDEEVEMLLDPMHWASLKRVSSPDLEWQVQKRHRKRNDCKGTSLSRGAHEDQANSTISGPKFFRDLDVAVASSSIADDKPTRTLTFDDNVERFEFYISKHDPAFPNGRYLATRSENMSIARKPQTLGQLVAH